MTERDKMDVCVRLLMLACLVSPACCWLREDEVRLQTTLLDNYTTTVRPAATTNVFPTLVLLSLNSLSIEKEVMSTTSIFVMYWVDDRLQWDPDLYSGIEDTVLPAGMLWTPPIVIENAITNLGKVGGSDRDFNPVRIQHTGKVLWLPAVEMTTSCEMRIAQYPFDQQTCTVIATVWTMTTVEVDLQSPLINVSFYSPNGEWDIKSNQIEIGSFFDGANTYRRVFFHLTFRRKWQFYSLNLLLPIVLMSVLMCFVFALPIESGEKMGYSLTVLLSYVVFLTWVTDNLPSTSIDISVLQVYLAIVLCMGALATLLTAWTVHLHHRGPSQPMNSVLRFFVHGCLMPLRACARGCRKRRRARRVGESCNTNDSTPGSGKQHRLAFVSTAAKGSPVTPIDMETTEKERARAEEEMSWPEVAAMFDRLFLIMYLVATWLLSVLILVILYVHY